MARLVCATMVITDEEEARRPGRIGVPAHRPRERIALTGPRSAAEFADNAGALEVALTPAGRAWLDLESDTAP